MGLKNIHVLFISMATALSLLLGSWCVSVYREVGGVGYLGGALFSFAAAVALALYGNWFLRKMKTLSGGRTLEAVCVLAASALLSARPAEACQVCFGDADSPLTTSVQTGVWFLLAVILLVEAGFGIFFFVYLRRRARAFRDPSPRPFLKLIKNSRGV